MACTSKYLRKKRRKRKGEKLARLCKAYGCLIMAAGVLMIIGTAGQSDIMGPAVTISSGLIKGGWMILHGYTVLKGGEYIDAIS